MCLCKYVHICICFGLAFLFLCVLSLIVTCPWWWSTRAQTDVLICYSHIAQRFNVFKQNGGGDAQRAMYRQYLYVYVLYRQYIGNRASYWETNVFMVFWRMLVICCWGDDIFTPRCFLRFRHLTFFSISLEILGNIIYYYICIYYYTLSLLLLLLNVIHGSGPWIIRL